MEESDISTLSEQVPNMMRAMGPGFFSSLGSLIASRQKRKDLEADRAFVESMFEAGETKIRYRGLAIDIETFADAQQEETERLITNQVNAMLKADSVVDWSNVNPDEMNPEFRRRWLWEASNVSDETLQDLWARLLAGELESPGSVSNDTMSIARDMNKECAEEFQRLCSAALCYIDGRPMVVVGCGNPGTGSLQPFGLTYDVLMRLAHHRLVNSDVNTYHSLPLSPSQPTYPVRQQESTWVLSWSSNNKRSNEEYRIHGILFTPAGKELFPVVKKTPDPVYTAAMLKSLRETGWTVIPATYHH